VKKELARKIVDGALSMDKRLGELDTLISSIEDEKQKKEFVQLLGTAIAAAGDIISRIEREYPDLGPE
jgi:hypothetical protein